MTAPMLEVIDLCRYFPVQKGVFRRSREYLRAVDRLTLSVSRYETLGLIGESGCGKSTLARTVLGLLRPTAGRIVFNGADVTALRGKAAKSYRRNMQMVFQDPFLSLNPKQTIRSAIAEPLVIHGTARRAEIRRRVGGLIESVGLQPEHLMRYPHEFSGGQRQRIGIARALALNPSFLILDEPTSALDVSVQAKILNLLKRLQAEFSLTFLFISHDLGVIRYVSHRLAVMYAGAIVETASNPALFKDPHHPYTQALLSAATVIAPGETRPKIVLKGQVPSLVTPPGGCRFHPRCPRCMEVCRRIPPVMRPVAPQHRVACHLYTGGEERQTA